MFSTYDSQGIMLGPGPRMHAPSEHMDWEGKLSKKTAIVLVCEGMTEALCDAEMLRLSTKL